MKKTIAMICTALFAAVALADTWTDPATGIEWTYMVSGGECDDTVERDEHWLWGVFGLSKSDDGVR